MRNVNRKIVSYLPSFLAVKIARGERRRFQRFNFLPLDSSFVFLQLFRDEQMNDTEARGAVEKKKTVEKSRFLALMGSGRARLEKLVPEMVLTRWFEKRPGKRTRHSAKNRGQKCASSWGRCSTLEIATDRLFAEIAARYFFRPRTRKETI